MHKATRLQFFTFSKGPHLRGRAQVGHEVGHPLKLFVTLALSWVCPTCPTFFYKKVICKNRQKSRRWGALRESFRIIGRGRAHEVLKTTRSATSNGFKGCPTC